MGQFFFQYKVLSPSIYFLMPLKFCVVKWYHNQHSAMWIYAYFKGIGIQWKNTTRNPKIVIYLLIAISRINGISWSNRLTEIDCKMICSHCWWIMWVCVVKHILCALMRLPTRKKKSFRVLRYGSQIWPQLYAASLQNRPQPAAGCKAMLWPN